MAAGKRSVGAHTLDRIPLRGYPKELVNKRSAPLGCFEWGSFLWQGPEIHFGESSREGVDRKEDRITLMLLFSLYIVTTHLQVCSQ